MKLLLLIFLFSLSGLAIAEELPYQLQVNNPEKKVGYVVGDIIQRDIKIVTSEPYKLSVGSLPVKGLSRNNIELHDMTLIQSHNNESTIYLISLSYQIFARGDYAIKLDLSEETLTLASIDKAINITIPTWSFTLTPLAAKAETYIANDISPYRGPMIVKFGYSMYAFIGSLLIVILSLIGLVYINGNDTWLPGMGGTFSSSYLEILSLTNEKKNIEHAINLLHQSFNKIYGENLFQRDIDRFTEQHRNFRTEINAIREFFKQSNYVLFDKEEALHENSLQEIKRLAKIFRHCERGIA